MWAAPIGGGNDKEDASTEPRRGGLAGVGVAARPLGVNLDAADKSDHRADGIHQFGARQKTTIEIAKNIDDFNPADLLKK